MSVAEIGGLTDILDRVKTWSLADRVALAKAVLETFAPDSMAPPGAPAIAPSSEEIRRTIQTDRTAPSDETIRRWRDEHLMEKYGA